MKHNPANSSPIARPDMLVRTGAFTENPLDRIDPMHRQEGFGLATFVTTLLGAVLASVFFYGLYLAL